jgi:hypothetical protein
MLVVAVGPGDGFRTFEAPLIADCTDVGPYMAGNKPRYRLADPQLSDLL